MKPYSSYRNIYQGTEPYIFVSYSHQNEETVESIIEKFMEDGYRVWYDKGIEPGAEWADKIQNRIIECTVFIAFISNDYVESDDCRDELLLAKRRRKQLLAVYLEETQLEHGMEMLISRVQSIRFYKFTFDDFLIRLYSRLTNSSLNHMLVNLNQEKRGIVVFLCDTENEINRLMERAPVLE